jgi:hypothetical protein
LQAAGVDATAYAAKLANGRISVIVLNKDAEKDLGLTLDFGTGKKTAAAIETLHAPSLESREARIVAGSGVRPGKDGLYKVSVPRASGLRITVG